MCWTGDEVSGVTCELGSKLYSFCIGFKKNLPGLWKENDGLITMKTKVIRWNTRGWASEANSKGHGIGQTVFNGIRIYTRRVRLCAKGEF